MNLLSDKRLDSLKSLWLSEEARAFEGWDFSHLSGRWDNEDLPWDYLALVKARLRPADRLLDIGTGGGEALLSLGHPYALTCATEDYEPNYELCVNKLAPLGITVVKRINGVLPFDDDSFDTVIARHEDCDFNELRRVLRQGGTFVTQQVGGLNNRELSYRLIDGFTPPYPGLDMNSFSKSLKEAGFKIEYAREAFPVVKFYDIGALVFFAKIIQWEFPGFSVERCFEKLMGCQMELDREGYLKSVEHRFVIVAG